MKKIIFPLIITLSLVSTLICSGEEFPRLPPIPLDRVMIWGYQLQGLEEAGAIDRLVESDFDLLVLEPMVTMDDIGDFDALSMVERLKKSPASVFSGYRKLVLAYVDIGEAEEWRSYFGEDWRPPVSNGPGYPDFMITIDPDGWAGNYPVAYWDPRWKDIIIYDEDSALNLILSLGFDGIYMDWVEAYDDETVIGVAIGEGIDPAYEMVKFIREIRDYARDVNPDFLVVSQNAPFLIEEVNNYQDVIDAIAMEGLSFYGEGDVDWFDSRSGDIPTPRGDCEHGDWCREELTLILKEYLDFGLPVFTVDYCIDEENAREAIEYSLEQGFVPTISRTPLSRLPDN